jgi:hypothetical protein
MSGKRQSGRTIAKKKARPARPGPRAAEIAGPNGDLLSIFFGQPAGQPAGDCTLLERMVERKMIARLAAPRH